MNPLPLTRLALVHNTPSRQLGLLNRKDTTRNRTFNEVLRVLLGAVETGQFLPSRLHIKS